MGEPALIGRQPVEKTIGGVRVIFKPLPFPQAQPLLPDVGEFIALIGRELAAVVLAGKIDIEALLKMEIEDPKTIIRLLPLLGSASKFFGQGRLDALAPRVLASTTVITPNLKGELERKDLAKAADRDAVFEDHPEIYFPVLFTAGSVTFRRFFPASALRGDATPTSLP